MERKEKGVEEREKKSKGKGKKKQEEEEMEEGSCSRRRSRRIKLRQGLLLVGKRGGPSTPSPTWRLDFSSSSYTSSPKQNNFIQEFLNASTTVSARKLCANLWEIQPSLSKMSSNNVHHHHHKSKKKKDVGHLVDPPHNISPPDQPSSPSILRRQVAGPVIHPRRSVGRNDSALQPISPPSHGSSMEVAPYKPVVNSSEFKGRLGESRFSLKTSTELLKVLNRIWSLEEQQSSNMSVLKVLTVELDHSRSQVKELLKEKQKGRLEVDSLLKQVAKDKINRRNKEQDRIQFAVQSTREELEDERKLRKNSDSLQRKLARELSEVKCSFSNIAKELERARKERILLENLCDEFAKGIRDYEQEVRSLRHKTKMDCSGKEKPDWLVVHISEAWLDERMQMKLAEAQNDVADKNTIVDKLGTDIETFLQARQSQGLRKDSILTTYEASNNRSRRESFPLNEAASAPHNVADEEDSSDRNSHCFHPNEVAGRKQSAGSSNRRHDNASEGHLEEVKSNSQKRISASGECSKVYNLASIQDQFEENMDKYKTPYSRREQSELRGDNQAYRTSDIYEATQDNLYETKNIRVGSHRFKSTHVLESLIRNHSLSSEGDKIHPEGEFTRPASPVRQWMPKLTSPEFEKCDSSQKLPDGLKENTLKAKLLEARLETQKSRSKASKASFVG